MISRTSIIRPYPTGACAPSAGVLDAAVALGLEYQISPDYRLDNKSPIDLMENRSFVDWPARIQGQRQTCIAFAVAACIELLHAKREKEFVPLSPQFLYWHMRQRGGPEEHLPPGWTMGATKLGHANEVLRDTGICTWRSCPYLDELSPGEAIEGAEPDAAATAAAAANRTGYNFYADFPDPAKRPPGVARVVYDQLAAKRPVAIAIPVFYSTAASFETNWDNPVTTSSGEVVDPAEGWESSADDPLDRAAPGHAVCIIGFQPDPYERTGGWFIFRNSRGMNWAANIGMEGRNPPIVPARGYGTISATYVEQRCWEILSPILA